MALVRSWGFLPIASLGLSILPHIVHADPVHPPQGDPNATSLTVAFAAESTPMISTSSVRKVHMRHGLQSRSMAVDSTHHKVVPTLISENPGTRIDLSNGLDCTGTWAWSLLCPDAQLIGINY
jgi:hypothetical protein